MLLLSSLAFAFDPAAIRAGIFRPADPTQERATAFATEVLAPLGPVVRTEQEGGQYADRVERRVRFEGVRVILGIPCARSAFSRQVMGEIDPVTRRDATSPAWGCPITPEAAVAWGLPNGTVIEFLLARAEASRVVLPENIVLTTGTVACRGELDLIDGTTVGRCELASPRRVNDVELPAGAVLGYSPEGQLRAAAVPGRTVTAAGRTWGPEYTPCGLLYLEFDGQGHLVPPEADPTGETCCD